MTDIDVVVERVTDFAKQMKVDSCQDVESPDMKSFVLFQQGEAMIGMHSGVEGHPVENLPMCLQLAFESGMRRFDSLSFVTDVYFRSRPLDEKREYERGDLAKEFSSNPFTDIVEALCVFTMSWSGESRVAVLQYKLDDAGKPLFVDTEETVVESGEQIGGLVKAILDSFVTHCKMSPSQIHPESN